MGYCPRSLAVKAPHRCHFVTLHLYQQVTSRNQAFSLADLPAIGAMLAWELQLSIGHTIGIRLLERAAFASGLACQGLQAGRFDQVWQFVLATGNWTNEGATASLSSSAVKDVCKRLLQFELHYGKSRRRGSRLIWLGRPETLARHGLTRFCGKYSGRAMDTSRIRSLFVAGKLRKTGEKGRPQSKVRTGTAAPFRSAETYAL